MVYSLNFGGRVARVDVGLLGSTVSLPGTTHGVPKREKGQGKRPLVAYPILPLFPPVEM